MSDLALQSVPLIINLVFQTLATTTVTRPQHTYVLVLCTPSVSVYTDARVVQSDAEHMQGGGEAAQSVLTVLARRHRSHCPPMHRSHMWPLRGLRAAPPGHQYRLIVDERTGPALTGVTAATTLHILESSEAAGRGCGRLALPLAGSKQRDAIVYVLAGRCSSTKTEQLTARRW